MKSTPPAQHRRALQICKSTVVSAAVALSLGLATDRDAQALTVMLDFVNSATTDLFDVGTLPETFATWGFVGMSLADIRTATLTAVQNHYLGYPSFATNALSPLPAGFVLDIKFENSNGLTAPTNGDSEWYYMAIGDANPNQGILGQACLGCVRNTLGNSSVANGAIFGSTLTDSIASLLALATTNAQRINLLAGTVSHEIGHGLGLPHPSSALPNPGASAFSVMATGAAPTSMPNIERTKERDFAYTEFAQLINNVGVVAVSPIPEPGTWLMMGLGLVGVGFGARRKAQPVTA
jgi:PEP-CTERM motif